MLLTRTRSRKALQSRMSLTYPTIVVCFITETTNQIKTLKVRGGAWVTTTWPLHVEVVHRLAVWKLLELLVADWKWGQEYNNSQRCLFSIDATCLEQHMNCIEGVWRQAAQQLKKQEGTTFHKVFLQHSSNSTSRQRSPTSAALCHHSAVFIQHVSVAQQAMVFCRQQLMLPQPETGCFQSERNEITKTVFWK